MQLLYTKHELEYCPLACEGEIGSERRNRRVWLNRRGNRPEESTQQELPSSHGAINLHLAFAGKVGGRMDEIGASG